jgi:hypothetical protein
MPKTIVSQAEGNQNPFPEPLPILEARTQEKGRESKMIESRFTNKDNLKDLSLCLSMRRYFLRYVGEPFNGYAERESALGYLFMNKGHRGKDKASTMPRS